MKALRRRGRETAIGVRDSPTSERGYDDYGCLRRPVDRLTTASSSSAAA
jgi:hypothetical protein